MSHQPNKFWVVVREDDSRRHRHQVETDAIAEAERLARKEGRGFYVLEACSKVRPLPQPPADLEWATTFPDGAPADEEPR